MRQSFSIILTLCLCTFSAMSQQSGQQPFEPTITPPDENPIVKIIGGHEVRVYWNDLDDPDDDGKMNDLATQQVFGAIFGAQDIDPVAILNLQVFSEPDLDGKTFGSFSSQGVWWTGDLSDPVAEGFFLIDAPIVARLPVSSEDTAAGIVQAVFCLGQISSLDGENTVFVSAEVWTWSSGVSQFAILSCIDPNSEKGIATQEIIASINLEIAWAICTAGEGMFEYDQCIADATRAYEQCQLEILLRQIGITAICGTGTKIFCAGCAVPPANALSCPLCLASATCAIGGSALSVWQTIAAATRYAAARSCCCAKAEAQAGGNSPDWSACDFKCP